MKRKLIRLLMISCLLAIGSIHAVAQEKKPAQVEIKTPPDGVFKVIAPKLAIGKVVKGAPYSATATTETIQTLNDGNQIIRKNESKIYRDSEGRTRTEQTLETIGKWSADGGANQLIIINDPVAGVSYNLDPNTHTVTRNVYAIKKQLSIEPNGPNGLNGPNGPNGTYTINGQTVTKAEFEAAAAKKLKAQEEMIAKEKKEAVNITELKTKLEMMDQAKKNLGPRKTASLGTQTIESVTVEGTSATVTIPAGEIGNTLPIEIVDETWYSPELQVNVMTKHRDPRSGETTYHLTNLNRSEPDHSLFEVPSDYTIKENPMVLKPKPIKEEQ